LLICCCATRVSLGECTIERVSRHPTSRSTAQSQSFGILPISWHATTTDNWLSFSNFKTLSYVDSWHLHIATNRLPP